MGWPVRTQSGHGMEGRLDLSTRVIFCPMRWRNKSHPTRKLCPMNIPARLSWTQLDSDGSEIERDTAQVTRDGNGAETRGPAL